MAKTEKAREEKKKGERREEKRERKEEKPEKKERGKERKGMKEEGRKRKRGEDDFKQFSTTKGPSKPNTPHSTKPSEDKAKGKKKGDAQKQTNAPNKEGRLIIRNLPFRSCNEKTLKKHFSVAGQVIDVNVPKKATGEVRGFAFLQFSNRDEAQKAIDLFNGKEVMKRPIAVDWSLPKQKYDKLMLTAAEEKEEEEEEEDEDEEMEDEDEDEDEEMEDGDEEEEDGESGEEEDDEEDDEKDEKEKKKKTEERPRRPEDRNCQLFLRNVSFDTQEEDLHDRFSEYGPVRSCLIVMDTITDRPRGTAFVHYRYPDGASAALRAAYEGLSDDVDALIANTLPPNHSLSRMESNIVLDGRRLIVSRAIAKSDAQKLSTVEEGSSGNRKDKRNIHLAYLGAIKPESDVAKKYTPEELDKKRKEFAARMKKLKQNTNLFVSPTRLALRNLPLELTEKELKDIVRAAVVENTPEFKDIPMHKVTKKIIVQSKILRDAQRLDKDGNKRSMGVGFVEFAEHPYALAAFHALSHKPLKKGTRVPFVEFAVEDVRIIQKRKKAKEKNAKKTSGKKSADDGEDIFSQSHEKPKEKQKQKPNPKEKEKEKEKEVAEAETDKKVTKRLPRSQRRKLNRTKKQENEEKGEPPVEKKKVFVPPPKNRKSFSKSKDDVDMDRAVKETEREMLRQETEEGPRPKRRRKNQEAVDEAKLEELVKEYHASLFG